MSRTFLATAVATHPQQKIKVVIVYRYQEWFPPYQDILLANPRETDFVFDIQMSRSDFITPKIWCSACRNTKPGCRNCQRARYHEPTFRQIDALLEVKKLNAQLQYDTMMENVQKFRDASDMFAKTVFENLSYLHFLRMLQNLTLQVTLHSFHLNFSHFDDFFRRTAIFYPVSQHLKDAGMLCQLSDKNLMRFVQFPNSGERIYPEFGDVSNRNTFLALSISMKILHRLVSSNHDSQSYKDRLLLKSHISNQISYRIIGMKLVPPAPKK
jgi:hypothetical protein